MDPTVTLALARDEARSLQALIDDGLDENHEDSPELDELVFTAENLLEHFRALDQWLTKGGALPAAWAHNRVAL